MGRRTKYQPEYAQRAYELCLLGYTVDELATHFGVNRDTIFQWQKKFPDFSDSIRKGREPADAKVVQALFRRAIGYRHKATKFFSFEGSVVSQEYTEVYPPDFHSIRFWLMNRQPKKWRDKPVDGENTKNEQLEALFDALKTGPIDNPTE